MTTPLDTLQQIMAKELRIPAAELTLDRSLESLGLDSLGIIELMFTVEEKLGIDIPDERVELVTVGDVVNLLTGLMQAKAQKA